MSYIVSHSQKVDDYGILLIISMTSFHSHFGYSHRVTYYADFISIIS